jgi:hypothetical protein
MPDNDDAVGRVADRVKAHLLGSMLDKHKQGAPREENENSTDEHETMNPNDMAALDAGAEPSNVGASDGDPHLTLPKAGHSSGSVPGTSNDVKNGADNSREVAPDLMGGDLPQAEAKPSLYPKAASGTKGLNSQDNHKLRETAKVKSSAGGSTMKNYDSDSLGHDKNGGGSGAGHNAGEKRVPGVYRGGHGTSTLGKGSTVRKLVGAAFGDDEDEA